MERKPTIAFYTLGCKLNFSESSTFARQAESLGYEVVDTADNPDLIVVNTCSVTATADKKGRNIIRRLHSRWPEALIGVTGCYAQLKPDEIAGIEGVAAVVGTRDKGNICRILDEAYRKRSKIVLPCDADAVTEMFTAYSSGERTRSFLKVQDGCDYRCSYCTVPIARGHSRNAPIADIVRQAREIAAAGYTEIVLTGVNTGDFGRTTGESFLQLLQALEQVDGILRYRISSIEPNLLTEETVRWIATGTKFLPHFHIPIQSGCDRILKAMGRRYDTAFFASRIAMIREVMEKPEERGTRVFFGIDVITGFPGETEEEFEQTYRFLEELRPAFLHVFPYSRRAGTRAAAMPGQVPERVKEERVARLEELCDRLHDSFREANRGRSAQVLFESTEKNGMMAGYTENYIRIERPYDSALIGRIVPEIID